MNTNTAPQVKDTIPAIYRKGEWVLSPGEAKAFKSMLDNMGLTPEEFRQMHHDKGAESKIMNGKLHAADGFDPFKNKIPESDIDVSGVLNKPAIPSVAAANQQSMDNVARARNAPSAAANAPVITKKGTQQADDYGSLLPTREQIKPFTAMKQNIIDPLINNLKDIGGEEAVAAPAPPQAQQSGLNNVAPPAKVIPQVVVTPTLSQTPATPIAFKPADTGITAMDKPVIKHIDENGRTIYSDSTEAPASFTANIHGGAAQPPQVMTAAQFDASHPGLQGTAQGVNPNQNGLPSIQNGKLVRAAPQVGGFISQENREALNDRLARDIEVLNKGTGNITNALASKYAQKDMDNILGKDTQDAGAALGANKLAQDDSQFDSSLREKQSKDAWDRVYGANKDSQATTAATAAAQRDQYNKDKDYELKSNEPIQIMDELGNKSFTTRKEIAAKQKIQGQVDAAVTHWNHPDEAVRERARKFALANGYVPTEN